MAGNRFLLLLFAFIGTAAASQQNPPGRSSMAFANMPTSPTKSAASKESAISKESMSTQEQPRSRAAEAPAIRRLLFPAESEPNERLKNFNCDPNGKVMSNNLESSNSTRTTTETFSSAPQTDHDHCGEILNQDSSKRGFDFRWKRVFAYDEYLNSTQAWTASWSTVVLSLHARAQLRINELKDARTVKALVEDLPKFARRVAPSTPTRSKRQISSLILFP
jgi:hypothetical protein